MQIIPKKCPRQFLEAGTLYIFRLLSRLAACCFLSKVITLCSVIQFLNVLLILLVVSRVICTQCFYPHFIFLSVGFHWVINRAPLSFKREVDVTVENEERRNKCKDHYNNGLYVLVLRCSGVEHMYMCMK